MANFDKSPGWRSSTCGASGTLDFRGTSLYLWRLWYIRLSRGIALLAAPEVEILIHRIRIMWNIEILYILNNGLAGN